MTHAERRLRALLVFWLILFGAGVIVVTGGAFTGRGAGIYGQEPLLVFVWIGQVVLFLATWYLINGLRDNELCAPVITWYKLVGGTLMVVLAFRSGIPAAGSLLVLGGGLLDWVQGGLTLGLWLAARRSRVQRLPYSLQVEALIEEEPSTPADRRLRLAITVSASVFALASLGLLAVFLVSGAPGTATARIAAGNACGVYAGLGFAGLLAAETPRRRRFALDIVVLGAVSAAVGLLLWSSRFTLAPNLHVLYRVGAAAQLGLGVAVIVLSVAAARIERPSRYLGAWLHEVFERFAEVVIQGTVELVTPRELAERADELLARMRTNRRVGVKLALGFIELGTLALRGRPPFSRLGRLERRAYVRDVFARGHGLFRAVARIKQLVVLLYYTDERSYKQIGFVKLKDRRRYKDAEAGGLLPLGAVRYPPPVTGVELAADICIVGSGAGGAVVAARLARNGVNVVLLEEGPYLKRDRITQDEQDMQVRAFRDCGLELSVDFDMYILQGRCVGGSTFLNNGIMLEPPSQVLREWHDLGATLPGARLEQAYARIRRDLQAFDLGQHQQLAQRGTFNFINGCQALGLPHKWFEVNLGGCFGCGYCTSGCPFEKKMSMDASYIPTALEAGATLVPEARAERIALAGRRATAVVARRADGSRLLIRAKKVVVACGAIHSSLLLRRSGIRRNVGTRLSFNLGTWVFAEFREPVDAFDGVQQCVYHDRPNFFLETFAMPPGAFAVAMPGWFEEHFQNMLRYRHFDVAGVLVGTQPVGRIEDQWVPVVRDLTSPVRFPVPALDLRKLRDGIEVLSRIWLAAGAMRVLPATFDSVAFTHVSQLSQLDQLILEADDLSLGSSHPQGGNPMSDDATIGVVDTTFRVHGVDNVFVCDASVFPTSVRVNPQLTVMALADCAADHIAAT